MKNIIFALTLLLVVAACTAVACRIAGMEPVTAIILLLGGALAAGFAASVHKALHATQAGTPAAGRVIGFVFRIAIGAAVIACMVAAALWANSTWLA